MIDLANKLVVIGNEYLFIFFILFLFSVLEVSTNWRRIRSAVGAFSIFLLILLSGTRWEVGTDWDPYYEFFNSVQFTSSFILNVYAFDVGYVVLNVIVRLLTEHYVIFLILNSSIALVLFFKFFSKNVRYPSLSVYLFFCSYFLTHYMGSNRRMVAISAGLFVFLYIFKRNRVNFFLWQIFSFVFHRSSLVLSLAWFVPLRRFRIKVVLLILILSLIIGSLGLPMNFFNMISDRIAQFSDFFIVEKLIFYSLNSENILSDNIDPIKLAILSGSKRLVFLVFYFVVIYRNCGILDKHTDFLFNLNVIGFSLYLFFVGNPIFQVLSVYFSFVEVILISRIWSYTEVKLKFIFLLFLAVYGLLQVLSSFTAYPDLYLPYNNFFYRYL